MSEMDQEFDERLEALGERLLCAYGFSVTMLTGWFLLSPVIAGTKWAKQWLYRPLGVDERRFNRINAVYICAWDLLGALLLLFPGLGLKFGGHGGGD